VTAVNKEVAKLYYEESKAASATIDLQVDAYRSRTTTVLALATGAAAFFGFADSGKGGWFTAALVAYGVGVGFAFAIFWPKRWQVNVASDMEADLNDPPDGPITLTKAHYDLATGYQEAFQKNLAQLDKLCGVGDRFRALIVCTALVVIFGGVNVIENPSKSAPTKVEIVEPQND